MEYWDASTPASPAHPFSTAPEVLKFQLGLAQSVFTADQMPTSFRVFLRIIQGSVQQRLADCNAHTGPVASCKAEAEWSSGVME